MELPKEGARYRAADGTIFVVETFTDVTDEDDWEEGCDRYALSLAEEGDDMSTMGYTMLEREFNDFCAEHGLIRL